MSDREELHERLCEILGSRNVYFQPPESLKIQYPAIVYGLENIKTSHANDGVYLCRRGYGVTLIDKNPDTHMVEEILRLHLCRFQRHFKKDNLNHYLFIVYF